MRESQVSDCHVSNSREEGRASASITGFYDGLTVVLLAAVFLYTCIRAYLLSITHDEAITYTVHASGSCYEIITYALPVKSNNHLLNSLLIKGFCSIFGVSEFVIRIPALIGHALYLAGIYKILRLFLKKFMLVIGACLLILHPFMLDMFSCARGYSLGLGFMILGVYFAFKRVEQSGLEKAWKDTLMVSIMMALSVFSNLSFLNVSIAVVGIVLMLQLKDICSLIGRRHSRSVIAKQFLKQVIVPIVPCVTVLIVVYLNPVIKMLRADEFWWGGYEGIWRNTLSSLIEASVYGESYIPVGVILVAKSTIVLLCGISVVLALHDLLRRKMGMVGRFLFLIVSVIIVTCISISLQHVLMGTRYPIDRTAIYFLPLCLLLITVLWKRFNCIENSVIRVILSSSICLLAGTMLFHFLQCANITHYYSWKYDASTKDMMDYVESENRGKTLEDNTIRMGIDWVFEPSINFYIASNNLTWMEEVNRNGPDSVNDYYYLHVPYISLVKKYDLKTIKYFKSSETYLAKPVRPDQP